MPSSHATIHLTEYISTTAGRNGASSQIIRLAVWRVAAKSGVVSGCGRRFRLPGCPWQSHPCPADALGPYARSPGRTIRASSELPGAGGARRGTHFACGLASHRQGAERSRARSGGGHLIFQCRRGGYARVRCRRLRVGAPSRVRANAFPLARQRQVCAMKT